MIVEIPPENRPTLRAVLRMIADDARYLNLSQPAPKNIYELYGRLKAVGFQLDDTMSSTTPLTLTTTRFMVRLASMLAHGIASTMHVKDIEALENDFLSWQKQRGLHGRKRIITLCGSTKFKEAFIYFTKWLSVKEDAAVFSVAGFMHSGDSFTPEQKLRLDDLHKFKIDVSDEIFVLDVGGYIGESTRSEIEYARSTDKGIRYLSDVFPDWTASDTI